VRSDGASLVIVTSQSLPTHIRRWFARVRSGRAWRRHFTRRPHVWQKLAIIGLAFTLPLGITTYLLVVENIRRIEFSENELRGLEYLRPLGTLLPDLAANRMLGRQVLAGERSPEELRASEARIDRGYAALLEVDARLGPQLRTTGAELNDSTLPATQARNWRGWRTGQRDETSNDAVHSFLISDVRALIGYVGVTSNLVLDPELGPYHLADALVTRTPELIDRTRELGDDVDELLVDGQVTLPDRTKVAALVALLTLHADALQNGLFTTFREDGGGQDETETRARREALGPHLRAAYLAVTNLTTLTTRNFVESTPVRLDRAGYARAVDETVTAMTTLWTSMAEQETRMLTARRAQDVQDRILALAAILAAIAVTALLTFWQSRRITRDVGTVARVATALAGGDLSGRVRIKSKDEIGAMAAAFNGMAERLEEMIEQQQRSRKRLSAERDFVDAILDVAGSLVLVLDREGRIIRFNRTCEVTLGYQAEEVLGRRFWELFPPEDQREHVAERHRKVRAADFPRGFESTWLTRSGDRRRITWSNAGLVDDNGELTHIIATGIDMTERNAAQEELREAKERFQQAFDNASIGMCLVYPDGRFMQVNPAICELLGRPEAELLTMSIPDVTHPEDAATTIDALSRLRSGETQTHHAEKRYTHADGRIVWALITASVVHSEAGEPLYYVTQIEDVTERRDAEARLVHQAMHDPLTGLPNRTLLVDRLRQVLARSDRHPSMTAVMFIDLDGFKDINDSLGHDIGDRVLRKVAKRLRCHVREADTVARLGGDEFVVLCQDLSPQEDVLQIADRLVRTLAAPVTVSGFEVVVTASVGIALANGSDATPEDLLRDADAAMYGAKTRGKNRSEVFTDALRAHAVDRVAIAATLRQGLRENRFVLHFQPVVDITTGVSVAVESLVRLDHPDKGLVSPGTFIQVAEDSGLIVPIGGSVLRQACRQLASWRADGLVHPGLRTTVNLSARQATRPDLVATVTAALAEAGLEPDALALELTETALMEAEAPTLRQLAEIREMGVGLGIDDFGTGYSSLSYLKRLPISFIKVDKSFVAGVVSDPSDREIVTAVIRLAQALGLTTVAEGVERADQFEVLAELGCDQAQGFLLGRPTAEPPTNDRPDPRVLKGAARGGE
jgi:diguanylate cyclase (GGDEF)-like protein/PAS domain S-box-containing protein